MHFLGEKCCSINFKLYATLINVISLFFKSSDTRSSNMKNNIINKDDSELRYSLGKLSQNDHSLLDIEILL